MTAFTFVLAKSESLLKNEKFKWTYLSNGCVNGSICSGGTCGDDVGH